MTHGPATTSAVDRPGPGSARGHRVRAPLRADVALTFRAVWALAWARRTVRGSGLAELLGRAMEPPGRAAGAIDRGRDALTVGEMADRVGCAVNRAASAIPGRIPCLERAMATWLLLSSEGVPARVRIGVSTTGRLTAHSWVETESGPVAEDAESLGRFRAFEMPEARARAAPGGGTQLGGRGARREARACRSEEA